MFLDYWNQHGGLAQQGFPISDVMGEVSDLDGKTYTVQYFERAVFEYHPEQTDPQYQVLLSQLGTFQYKQKYPNGAPNQQPNQTNGSHLFTETGHWVGGKFLDYWNQHGGLAQQGYPISDEFTEVSRSEWQALHGAILRARGVRVPPRKRGAQRCAAVSVGHIPVQGAVRRQVMVILRCAGRIRSGWAFSAWLKTPKESRKV